MQRRIAKQGSTPPGQPYAHEKISGVISHDKFDDSRRTNAHGNPHVADFLTLKGYKIKRCMSERENHVQVFTKGIPEMKSVIVNKVIHNE